MAAGDSSGTARTLTLLTLMSEVKSVLGGSHPTGCKEWGSPYVPLGALAAVTFQASRRSSGGRLPDTTPRFRGGSCAQPSQGDHDEPADRGLRRQAAGCCEGMEAVARELVRRDVIAEVAHLCALG